MYVKRLGLALTLAAACVWSAPQAFAQNTQTNTGEAASEHEWVASGFAGPTFGNDTDHTDAGFGGSLTYLRRGTLGGEFVANFTPNLNFKQGPSQPSTVNSYMVNAVAAVPVGQDRRWQPFVTGGIGPMTIAAVDDPDNSIDLGRDDTQLAGNVGVGIMAFDERWGFRSSLNYFTGFDDDLDDVNDDLVADDLLSPNDALGDVNFWRFNVGVAYRW
jgi:hypothetical protein